MAGADEVIAKVTEEMPEPQLHAIAATQEDAKQTASNRAMDHFGVGFDPDLHARGKDGNGILTVGGSWRKKRGSKASHQIALPGQTPGDVSIKVGQQIAETIFQIGQMLGGEEWAPQRNDEYGIDERRQMHDAWSQYAAAKEMEDFPPGVAISIAMLGYIAPRFALPKTKSRLQAAKDWVAEKYLSWRRRRSGDRTGDFDDEK